MTSFSFQKSTCMTVTVESALAQDTKPCGKDLWRTPYWDRGSVSKCMFLKFHQYPISVLRISLLRFNTPFCAKLHYTIWKKLYPFCNQYSGSCRYTPLLDEKTGASNQIVTSYLYNKLPSFLRNKICVYLPWGDLSKLRTEEVCIISDNRTWERTREPHKHNHNQPLYASVISPIVFSVENVYSVRSLSPMAAHLA